MYRCRENMLHTGKLFDRVVVVYEVDDPVMHHEMTRRRFRRDYYREKQYVHPMDHMLQSIKVFFFLFLVVYSFDLPA